MPRKVNAPTLKKRGKRKPAKPPYPSLANGPPAAERLANFLKETDSPANRPMTEDELDRWLEQFPNLWPDDAEIDEFVAWLHKSRREGRYA
jgi:hypothetical protein